MYISGPGAVYMLDRDNAVFQIPHLSFPARDKPGAHVRETLLDGVSQHYHCYTECVWMHWG